MASASKHHAKTGDYEVEISFEDQQVVLDGAPADVSIEALSDRHLHVLLDGTSYDVFLEEQDRNSYTLVINHVRRQVRVKSERDILLERFGLSESSAVQETEIKAPMPGLVLDVFVKPGDTVESGGSLLVLEAMKMENEIKAASAGSIARVHVAAGDAVGKNDLLIEFAHD